MTMSYNERLHSVGEDLQAVVTHILGVWHAATPQVIVDGAQWYDEQGRIIDDLARRAGLTREHVAAVFAHLSPRMPWTRNVYAATMLLTTGEIIPGCLSANADRARVALESADPLGTLNGPKTARFARNLLGEREPVTIDIWAARVALAGREDADKVLARVGMYEALEYAYQVAAERAGVDPATMQATTWVVARGGRKD